ncbi:hypothetical protein R1sor_014530 [Riccia sorocarpa]|uniref:sulfiredoxin n=1 Tax=Riccia sorocarpa TaxID=122646 RepID=A0ABD3HBH5_9MARC
MSSVISASMSSVIFASKNSNLSLAVSCAQSGSGGNENGVGSTKTSKGPRIVELPLDKIRRPLLRTRNNDQEKVKDLMASISEVGLLEPIDVLEVEGVYYGFSGCHRYEAHQKLGLPTIRCKVRKATKDTLR